MLWCSNQRRRRTSPQPTDSLSASCVRRCDLHVVWINFNMFNLMEEIDACGMRAWPVCVSSYWLAQSCVSVTGGLIESQWVIFHSNRKQMKCLGHMKHCFLFRSREELSPCFPPYTSALTVSLSLCPPRLVLCSTLAFYTLITLCLAPVLLFPCMFPGAV